MPNIKCKKCGIVKKLQTVQKTREYPAFQVWTCPDLNCGVWNS